MPFFMPSQNGPSAFFDLWHNLKRGAEFGARFSEGELHVHIGLMVFLAVLFIFRKRPSAPLIAFAVICAMQGLNELIDWARFAAGYDTRPLIKLFNGSVKDTARTLFWPFILMLIAFRTYPGFEWPTVKMKKQAKALKSDG